MSPQAHIRHCSKNATPWLQGMNIGTATNDNTCKSFTRHVRAHLAAEGSLLPRSAFYGAHLMRPRPAHAPCPKENAWVAVRSSYPTLLGSCLLHPEGLPHLHVDAVELQPSTVLGRQFFKLLRPLVGAHNEKHPMEAH